MTARVTVSVHGLLFLDPDERPVNGRGRGDPLDLYVRCAAACARSVTAQGHPFTLVTNDAGALAARFAALGLPAPALVEWRFALDVPAVPFRAAHRKLELFRAFAGGGFGSMPALVDLDAVLLRPLTAPPPDVIGGYHITDQVVPAYGAATVARDLAAVAGFTPAWPRWWGGEFAIGTPAAFSRLADAVAACWPRYLAALDGLHHHGDEIVTSAALALLAREGVGPVNMAGIKRWWSNRTQAPPTTTLRAALDATLLHLPADKPFLARFADPARDLAGLPAAYRRHVAIRWPAHRLLAWGARATGRPRRFAPRL